jgi:hypothetical protein
MDTDRRLKAPPRMNTDCLTDGLFRAHTVAFIAGFAGIN